MSEDLKLPSGHVLSGAHIEEQREFSLNNNHAAAFFQMICITEYPDGEPTFPIMTVVDLYDESRPTKSITNDAEYVTMRAWKFAMRSTNKTDLPIIYRDTEGNWDELRHREGHFACFRTLNTRDQDEALRSAFLNHMGESLKPSQH